MSIDASREKPDIIVWPETSVPFFFGSKKYKELTQSLIAFQRELNSYLIFGGALRKEQNAEKKGQKNPFKRVFQGVTNSAVLLDKKGAVSYIYDKIHLV
ncbi:hypothetical protein KA005_30425, partial [bacterium]|nr:hypothetical protein [bacterium]